MIRTITNKEKKHFKVWLVMHELSMRDFAKRCDVSVAYISKVINGDSNLTNKCIELFAKGGYQFKKESN